MHELARRLLLALNLALCLAAGTAAAQPETAAAAGREGFYRCPALPGQTVVFTAEGDLWRVGATGGDAQLDAAIDHLLRLDADPPVPRPVAPAYQRP